jgi:hypothetical protein
MLIFSIRVRLNQYAVKGYRMSRVIGNDEYLDAGEVTARYKLAQGTLYYFRELGVLKCFKFLGDKKTYWKVSELEALKNRPPEEIKRGPKGSGLIAATH